MLLRAILTTTLLLSGCAVPRIKLGDDTVVAPKDAGTPATLDKGEIKTHFAVPAQTKVVTTHIEPTPATERTVFVPARTVTEWTFLQPTEFEQIASTLLAKTGTIDTSVAKHRINAEERRWLLWAAIACGVGGLIIRSMLPAWPALSNGLLFGAVAAFAAWKLAEIPSWLWIAVIAVAVVLILGYKRAEWDQNKDGIPDFLQRPNP